MAQHKQLYELWKKAWLIKGKKTPESDRALEVRKIVVMRAYSQMKSPKLITEIIQPLTERETAPERAMQTIDSQGCHKGTVSLVSWEKFI